MPAIAAEQIERPPSESARAICPIPVEETSAVVKEEQPTIVRDFGGRLGPVQLGKCFCPIARRVCLILNDGGAFFLSFAPGRKRSVPL